MNLLPKHLRCRGGINTGRVNVHRGYCDLCSREEAGIVYIGAIILFKEHHIHKTTRVGGINKECVYYIGTVTSNT